MVSRIGQKHFSIYYSDDPSILDSWFKGIEIEPYVHYRTFERTAMFDGLSATKIRKAFVDGDKAFIEKNNELNIERYHNEHEKRV